GALLRDLRERLGRGPLPHLHRPAPHRRGERRGRGVQGHHRDREDPRVQGPLPRARRRHRPDRRRRPRRPAHHPADEPPRLGRDAGGDPRAGPEHRGRGHLRLPLAPAGVDGGHRHPPRLRPARRRRPGLRRRDDPGPRLPGPTLRLTVRAREPSMTSPHARPLPPLRDLPPPQRLPRESTSLVPPGEIIAESKAALRRRLLRIVWAPGLVLLGLWYVLLWLYVSGASPTFWFLSLLAALGDASYLDNAILSLGFTPSGARTAFMLVPAAATLLSLPTPLPAPALVAALPPPVLIVLALPVTVLLGMPQPWSGLGAGALSSWCLGIAALLLAWVWVRRLVPASKLLGITDPASLLTTARIDRDLDRRAAAAA